MKAIRGRLCHTGRGTGTSPSATRAAGCDPLGGAAEACTASGDVDRVTSSERASPSGGHDGRTSRRPRPVGGAALGASVTELQVEVDEEAECWKMEVGPASSRVRGEVSVSRAGRKIWRHSD